MIPWCSFLLVLCIGIGVQGHEERAPNLYSGRQCLLVQKDHGKINLADVRDLSGMNTKLCNDPWTLKHLSLFTSEMLCLGMGHTPLTGVTNGNQPVNIPLLNEQFKCSNETVKCTGKSLGDIVACYNAVLEVPMCHQVKKMRICAINCKAHVAWFNVQVNLCTQRGNNIRIYRPEITLHGIDLTSGKNDHIKEVSISDMLGVEDHTILMVPGTLSNTIKIFFEWRDARDAPADKFDLANLRKMWKELCLQDNSLQAAVPCEEMTEHMLRLCENTLDDTNKQKLLKLKDCAGELIPADIALQKRIIQTTKKNMCELSTEEPTIPQDVLLCSKKTVGTNTKQTTSWKSLIPVQFSWQYLKLGWLVSEDFQWYINFAVMFILGYTGMVCVFVLFDFLTGLLSVVQEARQAFSRVCSFLANFSKLYENPPQRRNVCWYFFRPLFKLLNLVCGGCDILSKVVGKINHKKARPRLLPVPRNRSAYIFETKIHKPGERGKETETLFIEETKKAMHEIQGKFCGIQEMISFQERADRSRITSMERKLAMRWAQPRMFSEAQDGAAAGNLRLRHDRDFG
jgi:hypothetical protein